MPYFICETCKKTFSASRKEFECLECRTKPKASRFKIATQELYCEGCHTAFFSEKKVKYCSDACKQKAYRNRKRIAQPDFEKIAKVIGFRLGSISCDHCKEPLTWSGKGRQPKYCSDSCRVMAHRKRSE